MLLLILFKKIAFKHIIWEVSWLLEFCVDISSGLEGSLSTEHDISLMRTPWHIHEIS